MSNFREVIVLQGASGAGKSTYAARLVKDAIAADKTFTIVSADDFFITPTRQYLFDPSRLSEAHGTCFARFLQALTQRIDVVIVDNTNTTAVEIAPYMLATSAQPKDAAWKSVV